MFRKFFNIFSFSRPMWSDPPPSLILLPTPPTPMSHQSSYDGHGGANAGGGSRGAKKQQLIRDSLF